MSEQEVEVLITMISSLIRPKFGKYFISSQVTYFNRGIFNYLNKNVNSTKLTSLVSFFHNIQVNYTFRSLTRILLSTESFSCYRRLVCTF